MALGVVWVISVNKLIFRLIFLWGSVSDIKCVLYLILLVLISKNFFVVCWLFLGCFCVGSHIRIDSIKAITPRHIPLFSKFPHLVHLVSVIILFAVDFGYSVVDITVIVAEV